jgi:hypothetical protein
VVVAVLGGLAWAAEFRQRAGQTQVTRAAYAEFGRHGPRIVCVGQDGNGANWNCRSLRWGDDPACRQVFVSWTGALRISRRTVVCE